MNVFSTKKPGTHPNTPWTSHNVSCFGKKFGQRNCNSSVRIACHVADDLTLRRVHREAACTFMFVVSEALFTGAK